MTGISLKIGYAACFGRSKGTPPGATKTDLALLEGPRDSQGAEKLSFCMCDNISLEPLAHSLEKKTVFENHQNTMGIYVLLCTLPSSTCPWGRRIRSPGPPLDPPMSWTLRQVHPRELPRAKHTLPKAPGTLPQRSRGPLGTSEMTKVDHQKPAKYEHLASKQYEKLIFCIFSRLMHPSEALPSARTRPPKPSSATQGPLQAAPGPHQMPLGPRQAALERFCKIHFKKVSARPPPRDLPRTPEDPQVQKTVS